MQKNQITAAMAMYDIAEAYHRFLSVSNRLTFTPFHDILRPSPMIDFTPAGPIPSLEEIGIRINAPIEQGPADIIPGFLPRRGQLVIAGETEVGKSLVALETVSCLVTGEPLWGELSPTLQAKKVLYVLGEHYPEVIQRLVLKTQLRMTDSVFLLGPEQLQYDKWLVANGRPNLQAISKFKKWAEGCDLIVFDPFSAFVSGVDVENDNITMRLVLDTMSLIAQTSGASCIVLAHKGKPMMDARGQEHARKSYGIRGASAIEDAATNIFYMERVEGEVAQKAADGMLFDMKMRKFKGEAPSNYRMLRNPSNLTHTLLGNRAFSEVQKIAAQGDVARLLAYNEGLGYREAIRLASAVRGISETTMKRHLGIKD